MEELLEKFNKANKIVVAKAIEDACANADNEEKLLEMAASLSKGYKFASQEEFIACIRQVHKGNVNAEYYIILCDWKRIVGYAISHKPTDFPLDEALDIYITSYACAAEKFDETRYKSIWSYAGWQLRAGHSKLMKRYEKQFIQK